MKPANIFIIIICLLFLYPSNLDAQQTGTPVFGRTENLVYKESKNCHKGAGTIYLGVLLSSETFKTNIYRIHRGKIPPKSGIGEHIHRNMEDMFFVFNAPAEFTVNGRTALLPAGSCVLCPMGSSHGIYNNSDVTLDFMNVSVTKEKDKPGSVDYNEDLSNQKIDSPAPFLWANFDRSLLKPVGPAHLGKGKILNRRPWMDGNFKTNWVRVGHCLLPPKTSIGYHQHNGMEEVYYIMSGKGRMTVNDHTWDVKAGDAIPCTLHDSHGIYNNTGEDLELFVIMVSMERDILDAKDWGDDLSER